ncbi:hypothetical protein BIY29_13675 [Brenneria alni]|uniref:Uncharacterized protein n=1 Tax=Brenneria alni TaxID=71656 RepID=A0A421DLK6_9GAMM|nr:hypothetical protein BIY29_13675 [Brenneria alni]
MRHFDKVPACYHPADFFALAWCGGSSGCTAVGDGRKNGQREKKAHSQMVRLYDIMLKNRV